MMTNEVQQEAPLQKLGFCMEEAAAMLDLSRATVFKEVASGRLKTYKVGTRRLTTIPFMKAFIADRAAESQQVA